MGGQFSHIAPLNTWLRHYYISKTQTTDINEKILLTKIGQIKHESHTAEIIGCELKVLRMFLTSLQ